ncbi:hypothetical protein H7X87_04550 [Acetobacteraceae bacterium]|nr:hypothetical protein [Candidatus Parcubacteria bacterium]
MKVLSYLPSAQFGIIAGSILLSGGLVVAAQAFTRPANPPSTLTPSQNAPAAQNTGDWLATLREIQAQNSSYTLPTGPNEGTVKTLLGAAQSQNITDTIGRSLLINLSTAKAQGLGADVPTQDKLIADAAAQIEQNRGAQVYTVGNLILATNTPDAEHTYGNTVMATLGLHLKASYYDTLLAIGYATDYKDKTKLSTLPAIAKEYKALADDLSRVAVPVTLAPLHLQIINNYARMADLYDDMAVMLDDPLRGLGGLELYESLIQETARVFTNIAQQLSKDGILFTKDEPGNTWSSLLP